MVLGFGRRAAAFVYLGGRLFGGEGSVRIIAYVVSGIGFLGAGVIMKEGAQVRGLNTAATLWSSAAVGAFAGSGLMAEAFAVTVVVLAGNTLLRPVVNYINRRPIDAATTEATYRVHVICAAENITEARDLLDSELEKANYPIREVEVLSEGEETTELAAELIPTHGRRQGTRRRLRRPGHLRIHRKRHLDRQRHGVGGWGSFLDPRDFFLFARPVYGESGPAARSGGERGAPACPLLDGFKQS